MLCVTHFSTLCEEFGSTSSGQRHDFAIKEEYVHLFFSLTVMHPNERLTAVNNAATFLTVLVAIN